MSSFTTIGTALLYMSSVLMGVLSMPNVASVLAPAERGPYLTFQVARDQVPQLLPVMPRASKRGPPNNDNLPRAIQNHARSRCESAGAARRERACRASRGCLRSREAIGLSWGGGLAVGTLFGAAIARPAPVYVAPAPAYVAPPCYWTRGAPVWDGYRGIWYRPRIQVCD